MGGEALPGSVASRHPFDDCGELERWGGCERLGADGQGMKCGGEFLVLPWLAGRMSG